eukprot:TRINITY_DN8152_c0_g1_i1.p1 TRINITY_DN8152_c0_g1~~TRINITY_DN8152_c0_g1_i1.p1  ORF type:complete len:1682 (+),score=269.38 TRINITY_DN8152_c0_g1_i1:85-5046(+)
MEGEGWEPPAATSRGPTAPGGTNTGTRGRLSTRRASLFGGSRDPNSKPRESKSPEAEQPQPHAPNAPFVFGDEAPEGGGDAASREHRSSMRLAPGVSSPSAATGAVSRQVSFAAAGEPTSANSDIGSCGPASPSVRGAEREEQRRRKVEAVRRLSNLMHARVAGGARREHEQSFEDKIDLEQLKSLKELFDEADLDGGGDLDVREFVQAFSQISGHGMREETLREWFMRIDANANGSVDWDEFSTYILLEGQQRLMKDIVQAEYIEGRIRASNQKAVHHAELITGILVHPRNGRYYTCSKDGMVKAWRANTLEHERVIYNGGSWVTDACLMKGGNRLMLACANRTLVVLDSNTAEMLRVFAGRKHVRGEIRETVSVRRLTDRRKYGVALDMERSWGDSASSGNRWTTDQFSGSSLGEFHERMAETQREQVKHKTVEVTALTDFTEPPTAMEYFCSESDHQSVLLGLRDGSILLYHLSSALSGTRALVPLAHRYTGHSNPRGVVTSTDGCAISRLKLSKHLQCVISGSWDGLVRLTKLEDGKLFQELHGHQKSVFSLDWSESLKIVATCGTERHVHIWNPFIKKPVFRLQGFSSPLINVTINDPDSQIITLGSDKCIKVWDVRTFRCMQTLQDNTVYSPENKLLALALDPVRHTIVTGARFPVVWPMRKQATKFSPTYTGHSKGVIDCLVSYFNHAISADPDMVYVWEVETGSRVFGFNVSRTMAEHRNVDSDQERLTAIAMDASGRRLLTGMHSGVVMMWNYVNGQPLNVFTPPADPLTRTCDVQAVAHHVDEDTGGSTPTSMQGMARAIIVSQGSTLRIYPDSEQHTVKQSAVYTQTDWGAWHRPNTTSSVGAATSHTATSHLGHTMPTSPAGSGGSPQSSRQHRSQGAEPPRADVLNITPVKRMLAFGLDCGAIQMYSTNTNAAVGRPMSVTYSPLSDGLLRRGGAALAERRRGASARRIEATVYLGRKSTLIVAACADGYIEWWNVRMRLLLHMMPPPGRDAIPCALATDSANIRLVIGYDDGCISIFDISDVPSDADDVPPGLVRRLMHFQAHQERVTGVQWVGAYGLILSSSTDCSLKVHSEDGGYLGWFGLHTWNIADRSSWQRDMLLEETPMSPPPVITHAQVTPGETRTSASVPESGTYAPLPDCAGSGDSGSPQAINSPVAQPAIAPLAPCDEPPGGDAGLFAGHPGPDSGLDPSTCGSTAHALSPSVESPAGFLRPRPGRRRGQRGHAAAQRLLQSPPRMTTRLRRTGPRPPLRTTRANSPNTSPYRSPASSPRKREQVSLIPASAKGDAKVRKALEHVQKEFGENPGAAPGALRPSPPPSRHAEPDCSQPIGVGYSGGVDPRQSSHSCAVARREAIVRRLEHETDALMRQTCVDPFTYPQAARKVKINARALQRLRAFATRSPTDLPEPADDSPRPFAAPAEQARADPARPPGRLGPSAANSGRQQAKQDSVLLGVFGDEPSPAQRHPGALSMQELDCRIEQLRERYQPQTARSRRTREELESKRNQAAPLSARDPGSEVSPRGGGVITANDLRGGGGKLGRGPWRCWSELPCSAPAEKRMRDTLREMRERTVGKRIADQNRITRSPRCQVCAENDKDDAVKGRRHDHTQELGGARRGSKHRSIGWTTSEIFHGVDIVPLVS